MAARYSCQVQYRSGKNITNADTPSHLLSPDAPIDVSIPGDTHGWPYTVTEREMIPFYRRREELSTEDSCTLWGLRVVIPPTGHTRLLKELHETHLGITQMKLLACGFIWWPGIHADIDRTGSREL